MESRIRMSKVKLALVCLGIFLGLVFLGYLLFTFLVKPKLVSVPKQNPVVGTGRTAVRPPNYKPPSILARLDFPRFTLETPIPQKVNKSFKQEHMFNTIDDAGNFFLFGVYKTASGKMLVAGIIQRVETTDGLNIWLEDEFGDPIRVAVRINLKDGKWLKVGSRNNPKALDLREELTIIDRDIDSLKNTFVGSRVVVEVEPNQEVANCLISACSKPNLSLIGKILYYD